MLEQPPERSTKEKFILIVFFLKKVRVRLLFRIAKSNQSASNHALTQDQGSAAGIFSKKSAIFFLDWVKLISFVFLKFV